MTHWTSSAAALIAVCAFGFAAGCAPSSGYTVSGLVNGSTGPFSLSLNGTETLQVNQGVFRFQTRLNTAATYNVTVATQPAGQTCTVANGSGTVATAHINNVSVTCAATRFHVNGNVSGLNGSVTLQLNGGENITRTTNGSFQFTTDLYNGSSYNVSVSAQPADQQCTVTNGTGSINQLDATANINCVTPTLPPVITHIWPGTLMGGYEVKISGSDLNLVDIAFNGAAITPTLQTPNELRFVAPQNPEGNYLLELENIAGYASQNLPQDTVMTNVQAVDSGLNHSCALLTTGAVQCWGDNTDGQLGKSYMGGSSMPVVVDGLSSAAASVSAGASHSCAVLNTGAVQCWGYNVFGQLGSGGTATSSTPITVAGLSADAVAVSAGHYHSCAVLEGGTVQCWGYNAFGQLGNGGTTNSSIPVTVTGLGAAAVSVSAGQFHSCALLESGTVQCWGYNRYGQLGNGTTTTVAPGGITTPVTVSNLTSAVSVTAGHDYSCAVLSTGAVQCWGWNGSGQLGNGSTTDSSTPVNVTGLNAPVVSLSTDYQHSCAVLETGAVQCWGRNNSAQLGNGSSSNSSTPVTVSGLDAAAVSVSTGNDHSCTVLNSGVVQCWGLNGTDQLGRVTPSYVSTPLTVTGFSASATSVTAGRHHSCAQLGSGAVQCWGWNNNGQLGNGSVISSNMPVTVGGLGTSVVSVSTSHNHSCAVLNTGAVQCWGWNGRGQLGDGTGTARSTPVTVQGLNAAAVSAATGDDHSCAVLSTGAVQCWGLNSSGQLGNGNTITGGAPASVIGLSATATAVSAGSAHSCAVLSTGAVQCWGANNSGQLGNGNTTQSSTPVTVTGLSAAAVSVSAGDFHNCALLSTGAVQCWGRNSAGELGNGSTANSSTPVTVTGLGATAVSISAGYGHTCAVLGTGTVRCWGWNNSGQLGNGTATHIPPYGITTPVSVVGIRNAVSVSTGEQHSCAALTTGAVQCWGTNEYGQLSLPTNWTPGIPVKTPN